MKKIFVVLFFLICSAISSHASILVFSPNGSYTVKSTLADAATAADVAGKTVVVTSALSASFSNISSATLHAWPTDRSLKVVKGGSIGNTTKFKSLGNVIVDGGTFSGSGDIIGPIIIINGGTFSGSGAISGSTSIIGLYQVFTGSSIVTGLKKAYPEWWANNTVPGTTDMTTALASASLAAAGYEIILTDLYAITGITLPANTTIKRVGGIGGLKGLSGSNNILEITTNCKVLNIEIDGNKSIMTGGSAIYANTATDIKIKDCYIHDTYAMGINFNNITRYDISGNKIMNCTGQGMDLSFSDSGTVIKNYIDTCLHGIQWWGGDSATSSTPAIFDILISDNIVKNTTGGIWGSLGQRITVIGNTVSNSSDVGIDFEGCAYSTASGNTIDTATNGGIATFYGSNNISITGNSIYNPGIVYGIKIHGNKATSYLNISSNNISVTSGVGVYCDATSILTNSNITGNNIFTTSGIGILLLDADYMDITNNKIRQTLGNRGIDFEGGKYSNISSNTIITDSDGSSAGANGGIFIFWRDSTYSAQLNMISNNYVIGYSTGINDSCGGDTASYNWFNQNRTNNIYRKTGTWYGAATGNVLITNPNTGITPTTY